MAPAGYGKTCLAASYGRLAFGPKRFWWVDASDPRFLFDLDAIARGDSNQIKDTLESRRSSLIVFDAVPCLSLERKRVFGGVLQRAQSRGWEILVTSRDLSLVGACAHDRQCERQRASFSRQGSPEPDAHEGESLASGGKALLRTSQGRGTLSVVGKPGLRFLFAQDLLLDESERTDLMGAARHQLGARVSLAGVPSIAFSEEGARVRFLTGLATGPFSLVEALSLVSLLLGSGKISDLDHFADRSNWEGNPRFSRDYPHAGIGTKGDFRSPLELTSEEKLFLLASCGDSLANALFGEKGAIVPFAGVEPISRAAGVRRGGGTALYLLRRRLVDRLVDAGDLSLAGRIIAASGDAVWARAFFDSWTSHLLKECEPLAAVELAQASDTSDASWEFLFMSALSHMGLGNNAGARDSLRKARLLLASEHPSCEDSGKGPALTLVELLLVLVGSDSARERRTRVRELVVTLSEGEGVPECEILSFVRRSAVIALSVEKAPMALKQALEKDSFAPEGLSALVASLLVMDWLGSAPEGTEAAELISAFALRLQKQGAPEWQCFVLARFASRWLVGSIEEALGPVILRKGRLAQTKLAGQVAAWKAQEPDGGVRFGAFVPGAHIGGVRVSNASDAPSSKGKLRLFGGFDLRLPRPVDGEGGAQESSVEARGGHLDSVAMRAKARILVGLLAANHGCEVSREWLGSALWPLVDRNSQRVS
ncbi:MAG: hypothetical protein Q4F23_05795, partial [Coriobacteriia bacterium]|nr:hypothetical protein [Coriobacteriia bacterium]